MMDKRRLRDRIVKRVSSAGGMTAGALALALVSSVAGHAQGDGDTPPNAASTQISPKIAPDTTKPVAPSGFNGPLATFAAPLADKGITFHVLSLDFVEDNPSLGLQRGRGANSDYIIEGVDADLSKLFGLHGLSLHYENVFFAGVRNLNIAPQIGDSQTGYQPPFTPRVARLSRATVEQTFLNDKLDFEIGATHPGYTYALFNCDSINSCFQDILYEQAGYTSFKFAVPGANLTYSATKSLYAEAGVFAVQPNANNFVGYDFYEERYNGVLGIAEIGDRTTFATDPYPHDISLTGYINTANHEDYNAATAFGGPTRTVAGTSGVVFQADKIVYRPDHGDLMNATPTAVKVYGSVGTQLDSTEPISSDIYVGTTLIAPFAGRPADRFGLKFNWERLNPSYTQYLTAENLASGGAGIPYKRDKFIFEANAHFQLPAGTAFEPVVQYDLNPNSFFNPATPTRAHRGVYIGGTFVVPVGTILGLAAGSGGPAT